MCVWLLNSTSGGKIADSELVSEASLHLINKKNTNNKVHLYNNQSLK